MGPGIPLFWTSGDIHPGLQGQDGSSHLHVLWSVCNEILRFTSGVTHAGLFFSGGGGAGCMAKLALVGIDPGMYHAVDYFSFLEQFNTKRKLRDKSIS